MEPQFPDFDPTSPSHRLLHAVERMVDEPDGIIRVVESYRRESPSLDRLCERVVSHYSNRSALVGGLSALPGLVPGVGTLAVTLGTTVAEMAVVLGLEVEMCMALAHAHGFDIRERRERALALVLAAVHTSEVESGRNVLLDICGVSWTAVVNYAPRELEKLALQVVGWMLVAYAAETVAKGLLRSLPFVGIGVGAGLNKVLTRRVGRRARMWLFLRAESARRTAV